MKIVAADPGSYIDKFNFRSEICISCDWRRLELSPKVGMPRPELATLQTASLMELCTVKDQALL